MYLKDGTAVPWNGLVSVDDGVKSEITPVYLDGVKVSASATPGEFDGKLTAFTYPDEFDQVTGITETDSGLFYHEQPPKSFHLSYRTKIGNDVMGDAYGYKIHVLYNLLATPESHTFETLGGSSAPSPFSWSLAGVPPRIVGRRPTVHVSIDSRKTEPDKLVALENILSNSNRN